MPPSLPIESALESPPEVIGHGSPTIPIRIMLVVHDVSVRKATCMLLRSAGHEVVAADSIADAAFQLAQHPRLDLIMTDSHLRDGTGRQVIALARGRMGRGLPAVLLNSDPCAPAQDLASEERLRMASPPLRAERLLALIDELVAA